MGGFFAVVVIALVVFAVFRATGAARAGGRSFSWLVERGTPARGILLQVDSIGMPVAALGGGTGVERRNVTIDVEIVGRPPYTVVADILIPRNLARDVLPGATVELRVDPRNQNRIAVVGPGTGFAASALIDQRAS